MKGGKSISQIQNHPGVLTSISPHFGTLWEFQTDKAPYTEKAADIIHKEAPSLPPAQLNRKRETHHLPN